MFDLIKYSVGIRRTILTKLWSRGRAGLTGKMAIATLLLAEIVGSWFARAVALR